MFWLAIHLPALSLEAVVDGWVPQGGSRGSSEPPLCITEAGRILALSNKAQTVGVHIGMTVAAASSLAPGLVAIVRQPPREAALLQRLALALSCYTPMLLIEPEGLLLELSTTRRLFGGARKLLQAIQTTVQDCGIERLKLAEAATPKAASLLVRFPAQERWARQPGQGQTMLALTHKRLDQMPLAMVLNVWQQAPRLGELLQGIGCRTLGDVRALPTGGLHRRGGRALMSLIAQAYADEPDPQTWFEPPPQFQLGLELLHRADEAGALVFATQRLMQALVGWLAQRWLAASRLSLHLKHETARQREQPDSVLRLELAEPSRDAAQIMLLLRERLQRMPLPAPVYAITLRVDDAVSHAGRAGSLWRSPASQHESERALIDRLSARLGSDRVQRVQRHADHRPERAMQWVSAQSLQAGAEQVQPKTTKSAPATGVSKSSAARPPWVLASPLALREKCERPLHEGKPLIIISPAERIEAGWFDGALISRDYHVAATEEDCCCYWIFRERRADAPARWFLHGIFG